MKEVKITNKMKMAIDAVKELGGVAYADEVLNYLNEKYADRADLQTFNSVNATLAAIAGKGLATKGRGMHNEKLLTNYTLITDGE